jgi:colicin import membrane protein
MTEPVDAIKLLQPFAQALVDLGPKLEALGRLDTMLIEANKKLADIKQEQADTKAATEASIKAAADAKAEVDKHAATRTAEIDDHHQKSMTAIEEARAKAAAEAKMLMDNATESAAAKKLESEKVASATIAKAQADAEAIKKEHADLTEATIAARTNYSVAKSTLDDINAKLDSIRRH